MSAPTTWVNIDDLGLRECTVVSDQAPCPECGIEGEAPGHRFVKCGLAIDPDTRELILGQRYDFVRCPNGHMLAAVTA